MTFQTLTSERPSEASATPFAIRSAHFGIKADSNRRRQTTDGSVCSEWTETRRVCEIALMGGDVIWGTLPHAQGVAKARSLCLLDEVSVP